MATQEMILMLFLHLPHMWAGLVMGRTVKMLFPLLLLLPFFLRLLATLLGWFG